jgi:hypothetical protein
VTDPKRMENNDLRKKFLENARIKAPENNKYLYALSERTHPIDLQRSTQIMKCKQLSAICIVALQNLIKLQTSN